MPMKKQIVWDSKFTELYNYCKKCKNNNVFEWESQEIIVL